jgi:hypothetical protein
VRVDEQPLPPRLDAKGAIPVADDPVLARVLDLQSVALRLACRSELDSECPKKFYVLLVFGRARPGPPESVRDRPAGLTPNSWSIRVVESQAVPGNGFGVVSSDYTYDKQSDGSWKFLGVSFVMAIP